MTISQVNLDAPSGAIIFKDTDNEGTKIAVKGSSAVVYGVVVDNAANGAATYTKLWNVASGGVTVGTTAPDVVIMTPASVKRTVMFPEGVTFDTALTIASVTTAGTGGTTNPTSSAIVSVIYV